MIARNTKPKLRLTAAVSDALIAANKRTAPVLRLGELRERMAGETPALPGDQRAVVEWGAWSRLRLKYLRSKAEVYFGYSRD